MFGRIILTVVTASLASTAWAGSPGRTGTSGALELLLPTDARGVAMGGSVMAESQGARSWFWNPAGAADLIDNEITVSHRGYIADMTLSHFAYARDAGDLGVIGLSAKILSSGDEAVYTTAQPDGTGETWSASYVVVGLSYARTLTDRVSFGLNGHYIAEEIYRETAQGLAFDIGFIYRPAARGLSLGVAIKNYGPKMSFDGPDFELPQNADGSTDDQAVSTLPASFELPSFIQFGVAWDAWHRSNQNLRLVGAFQANNFSEDEYRVGGEWSIANQLFLRSGYAATSQTGYPFGFSAGAGVRIPLGDAVTHVDYAWCDAGVFGDNHLFTISLAF
ncbi:MAG TPA: PorV/PorQ family protein [Acidobacteriota bacterium]|nr:PorV/PorQ family protein [Acidobacteriota bacterium]